MSRAAVGTGGGRGRTHTRLAPGRLEGTAGGGMAGGEGRGERLKRGEKAVSAHLHTCVCEGGWVATHTGAGVSACACVRACVCVCACVLACVRACVGA